MSSSSPDPLVALISSPCAQQNAVERGFKSIAHLLSPFTIHDCQVREPIENSQISHRVRLDIRDISNDGHLLSLSVLPHVLIQALKSSPNVSESIETFREVLNRWAEPSEHESFGAYLACIFVVTTNDENPLGELSRMIQTQQTLYNSTSTLMIPPFCCSPKWATAHAKTPKHYILLDDGDSNGESRRNEIFTQMCTTYGNNNCQILQLEARSGGSSENSEIYRFIDGLYDVLTRGLDDAFKHAAETTPATSPIGSPLQSPSSPSSVSTISSILPNVAAVSPNSSQPAKTIIWSTSIKKMSVEDGKNAQAVLGKFLTNCLTPHVEREMRSLYEAVGQKKGIGKSISTGMRKWFGTGSSSGNLAVPASYSWDSAEMQTRRLADLLLMFGSYGAAYDQYLPLKRDLEADKAMVAHSVALEMCVVALRAAQPGLNAKQFPIRYLDSPLANLLEHSKNRRYPSILRCAFNIADVYAHLGCHKEAAATLSRLSAVEGDHLVAVGQTLAAEQFEKAGMLRKASFHRVLAANRYSNAGISGLAFDCFRLALSTFDQKHWGVLDEHLAIRLLSEGEKASQMTPHVAAECVRRLVAVCPKLSSSLQSDRLTTILRAIGTYPSQPALDALVGIPKVEMDTIKVVCGERPLWNEIDDNEHQSVTADVWTTVERGAHHALFGASAPYRGMQLVSDEHSDNQKTRETPCAERFRVMVDLTNPLKVGIELTNVRLSVTDVHHQQSEQLPDIGTLPHLRLDAEETQTVELYVFPRIGCLKFRVDALLFRLAVAGKPEVGVEVRVPLECRGKRLNKTAKQRKTKTYAHDERLSATVAQKAWPLVEFRVLKSAHKWSYCDQAQRYQLEVENIGNEDVVSMCLATNAFDRTAVGILTEDGRQEDVELRVAANDVKTATFHLSTASEPFLRVGEKKRVFFDVRSADETTASSVAPKTPNTVVLIAYRSANGTMRQWRKVVDGERRRLVGVKAEVLDFDSRTFALHLKNCVAVSQAALSRVEILRVRTDRNAISTSAKRVPRGSVLPLSPRRKIEIESDQTDTFIGRLDVTSSEDDGTWLTTSSETAPRWPCPAVIQTAIDDPDDVRVAEKIGVFWKANIVNNEGLVTSFIGESFVDDPFARKLAESSGVGGEVSNLRISCETSAREVSHDFSRSKLCELPITLRIHNTDRRAVRVAVKCAAKVRDAVDGIHLVAPEHRQQMCADRPVRRRIVGVDDVVEVTLKWRVAHAAVYDVAGANLSVEAEFEGAETDGAVVYTIPSVLSVVKSTSSM